MPLKTIDAISLTNKRVFIRVDFNVPLTEEGKVADDLRIHATLPTICHALKNKACVILASHLGRPEGEKNPKYSLAPVAEKLMELLELPEVIFPEDCVGGGITKLSKELEPGQVILLENLRFHPEEEKNDPRFAKKLASLCDVYINDAFGASHRAHASIVGIVSHVSETGVGFLMQKEIEFFSQMLQKPKRPFVALLGGAKVSDKIGVLESLLNTVDSLCIGGAMAMTFLKAQGRHMGNSKVEGDKLYLAKKILGRAEAKGVPLFLPVDHTIAQKLDENSPVQVTETEEIPSGWMGVDIGPKTIEMFTKEMQKAKMVFWNGPLGIYEIENFALGTQGMAKILSELKAVTIIGGGDSAYAVEKAKLSHKMTHISTGGGASLEFIEKRTLPGLRALGYT